MIGEALHENGQSGRGFAASVCMLHVQHVHVHVHVTCHVHVLCVRLCAGDCAAGLDLLYSVLRRRSRIAGARERADSGCSASPGLCNGVSRHACSDRLSSQIGKRKVVSPPSALGCDGGMEYRSRLYTYQSSCATCCGLRATVWCVTVPRAWHVGDTAQKWLPARKPAVAPSARARRHTVRSHDPLPSGFASDPPAMVSFIDGCSRPVVAATHLARMSACRRVRAAGGCLSYRVRRAMTIALRANR